MRFWIGVGLVMLSGLLTACRPASAERMPGAASPSTEAATEASHIQSPSAAATRTRALAATPTTQPTPVPAAETPIPTAAVTEAAPTPSAAPCDALECQYDGHLVFARPVGPEGNTDIDPTYRYGSTQGGIRRIHHGVELLNPLGTPVLAAGDGVVAVAGTDADHHYADWYNHYGNLVVIQHELPGMAAPVYTLYAHLSKILAEEGDVVRTGDVIGEVGFTGRATGSHLHFEVRVGENEYSATRNPALWWNPRELTDGRETGVLAGQIRTAKGAPWYFPEFTIERMAEDGETVLDTTYVETYADETVNGDDNLDEDFAIGDLAPGMYRIKFVANGLQSHLVEVQPGKVTFFNYQAESERE